MSEAAGPMLAGMRVAAAHHLGGHILRFGPRPWPDHPDATGLRLLGLAVVLEAGRTGLFAVLRPAVPLWVLAPALLAVAIAAVPVAGGVPLAHLGLRRWREWSVTERSYFLQVMGAAAVLAIVVLARSDAPAGPALVGVFVPYLAFGFYQELVYRGLIQRELTRRWGAMAGVIVASVLYTLGPLHARYLAAGGGGALMLGAVFLMGLFFGALYHRSGNLWIVGGFHAAGNALMVWAAG